MIKSCRLPENIIILFYWTAPEWAAFSVCGDAVADNLIVAYRVTAFLTTISYGVSLYGIHDAVFYTAHNTDMVCNTVLTASFRVVPVIKDNHSWNWNRLPPYPLPMLPEPIDTPFRSGESWESTCINIPALIS